MGITDEDLYNLILEGKFLEEDKLKKAQEVAKEQKSSLYDALIGLDLISDQNLGNLISDSLKIPFISLGQIVIPQDVLEIIPESVADKQKIIVFGKSEKGIKIATAWPDNQELLDMVSKKAGGIELVVHYATSRDIEDSLRLYKKELQKTFDEMLSQQVDEAGKAIDKEVPMSKLVDTLIEYAYESKASDIHIEPQEEDSLIRFRIDGVLHDELKLPKNLHDQIITRIKVLSRLRTDEHLSAQDGKMQLKLEKEALDIRVSIVPIVEGEKVVMRLLSSRSRQFSLTDLGMGEEDLDKVKQGFSKPYGMVLSTGPTGSGKTTTIYAILKILNTREKNIATIEDPVEYDIDGINQIQVNPKTNLTFADGLRSILRQDPDIIFVGEIRDEETAAIAVNSATTGHLVVSTLHTNDAATGLVRLIDMDIEPFLVSSTVNVIIAQRLVRRICQKCKVSSELKIQSSQPKSDQVVASGKDKGKKSKVNSEISDVVVADTKWGNQYLDALDPALIKKHFGEGDTIRLYHGKGCPVCHGTGYIGRVGIFEVLQISGAVQKLINAKADADAISKQAVLEGMNTMFEDGLNKVQQGITTVEEVLSATKS